MALTNCPGTMTDLQAELGVSDDEYRLEIAGNAAARQIRGFTGWPHGFWADPTVMTRLFYATGPNLLYVPEGISTDTGLIVETDTNRDGTFATTLLNTDLLLFPLNAAFDGRPYTEIQAVDSASFPSRTSGRPGIRMTATFGWPEAADDVKKAWLIQSVQLYKASDAVFGAIQLGEGGFATRVGKGLNPMAESLLQQYLPVVIL